MAQSFTARGRCVGERDIPPMGELTEADSWVIGRVWHSVDKVDSASKFFVPFALKLRNRWPVGVPCFPFPPQVLILC